MKSTGIIRKVDNFGRIVLPIEIRNHFDIDIRDQIEIYTDIDKIVLKKFELSCLFCGKNEDIVEYKGKSICDSCLKAVNTLGELTRQECHDDTNI